MMWLAIGFLTGALFFVFLWDHPHEADHFGQVSVLDVDCEEDAVWMFVDHDAPNAVVDSHGVTRMCISYDLIVSDAIEVAIQEDVLMYVPNQ
jgi:hypothetical protein